MIQAFSRSENAVIFKAVSVLYCLWRVMPGDLKHVVFDAKLMLARLSFVLSVSSV